MVMTARMRNTVTMAVGLLLALCLAGPARADDGPAMDPLLRLLVKKGVITHEEAVAIQKEYDAMKAGRPAEPEPAAAERTEVVPEAAPERAPAPGGLENLHLGTLIFASYQDARVLGPVPGETVRDSRFTIKRAYLDVRYDVAPFLQARLTPDVRQDETGDWKGRFKYVYGRFHWERWGFIGKPAIEFGLAHMPWLDWEEAINGFRMQDPMFMERNHLFNSADLGVLLGGNFGDELPETYRREVNRHYAGRWGSFQIGIFNGGGYHSVEQTSNKAVEARVSFRPMPDSAPGFQLTAFGLTGEGNTAAAPDWNLAALMASWESPRFVVTAQWERGKGNQSGRMTDARGRPLEHEGYSIFGRVRLGERRRWHLIGRWDRFDPDREAAASDVRNRWIAGVGWEFLANNIWLLDYERLTHDAPGLPDEHRFQLTLQIKY